MAQGFNLCTRTGMIPVPPKTFQGSNYGGQCPPYMEHNSRGEYSTENRKPKTVLLPLDLRQFRQGLFDHLIRVEFDILKLAFQEGVVGRQVEVAVAR